MGGMDKDCINRYLKIIKEIHKAYYIYDIHLHAFDVMLPLGSYYEDDLEKGLYRLNGGKYVPPSIDSSEISSCSEEKLKQINARPALQTLMIRKTYTYSGPKVFRDYFHLCGIDKGLFLAVAPPGGSMGTQMKLLYRMFSNDDRFSIADSVPEGIQNQDILNYLRNEIKKYNIVAVKVHPNITEIDLNRREGKERIECIFDACEILKLPMIIHVGPSFLPGRGKREFIDISHISEVRINGSAPVILAHGGACGHSCTELENFKIPILKKVLERNPNAYIDISGLDTDIIALLLSAVGIGKTLFGSDGLYENPMTMLMRLCAAVDKTDYNLEKSLLTLLSKNAAEIIFNESPEKNDCIKLGAISDTCKNPEMTKIQW